VRMRTAFGLALLALAGVTTVVAGGPTTGDVAEHDSLHPAVIVIEQEPPAWWECEEVTAPPAGPDA